MPNILRESFGKPCFNCPFRHPTKGHNFSNQELTTLAAGDYPCNLTRKPVPVVEPGGRIMGVQMVATDASRKCAGAEYFKEFNARYRNYQQ